MGPLLVPMPPEAAMTEREIAEVLRAVLMELGWVNLADPAVCHGGHAACVHVIEDMKVRDDAARAEQREASAGLIYALAHSMAERGLFVRDDFGEPNIHAIHEIEVALRSQR